MFAEGEGRWGEQEGKAAGVRVSVCSGVSAEGLLSDAA